jgi:pilus assembly protein CpaB
MRRSNSIVLILAVVMGLAAAYLARQWISSQAGAVPAIPTKSVVVALTRASFGTELTRENVAEISWSAEKLPEGAFATKADLFKDGRRVVLTPMNRDELVLTSKITGPGQRASLSALLEGDTKAVTVRVDDVRGVAGFVLPGDRVDVVLIRAEARASGQTENSSEILVQHVKVLAVDQVANERQEQATVAKAVTLEVSTEQAQKIILATNVGRLSLILRRAGQSEPEVARRITDADLGLSSTIAPVQVPLGTSQSVTAETQLGTVDIIRGTKRESYNVQLGAK